jgi:hypothetical protein
MTSDDLIRQNDLEEAAQGQDLFRAPGRGLQAEQARDQATASGWLPAEVASDWPSTESHQDIVERRRDLYEAMQLLEASVARASGRDDWNESVSDALDNLKSSLDRHVEEIEGPGGLFSEVLDMAPRLASVIENLRLEHDEMLFVCRAASTTLSEGVDPAEVRRKVIGLLGRLAMHRQNGAELLFDAYNVDVSGGD